jgi:hypothetical protein
LFGILGNTAELNEHGREAHGNTLYEVETGFNSNCYGGSGITGFFSVK